MPDTVHVIVGPELFNVPVGLCCCGAEEGESQPWYNANRTLRTVPFTVSSTQFSQSLYKLGSTVIICVLQIRKQNHKDLRTWGKVT